MAFQSQRCFSFKQFCLFNYAKKICDKGSEDHCGMTEFVQNPKCTSVIHLSNTLSIKLHLVHTRLYEGVILLEGQIVGT